MPRIKADIEHHLTQDRLTSKQLQAATDLSQPAVSRQLQRLGDRIVKLPNGRNPKYALTCNAFGSDDKIPLLETDRYGYYIVAADIRPLETGGFFVQLRVGGSPLLLGCNGTGIFDDLPYYLQDLRPQGFVGREIARALAEQTGAFPPDPTRWNTDHVGRFLLSNGQDLPGNFRFGHNEHARLRRKPTTYSRADYPSIANQISEGELAGSSAGGEQPKFTVYCEDRSAHVIVKFSPSGERANARRWRDILITEYHATEALHELNIPVAEATLLEIGDRLFLECERFDRSGQFGRSSMISAQMIDAEFVGDGADWPIVLKELYDQKLLSRQHYFDACALWEFGYLINNTDMHLGNLSLSMTGDSFSLLPAYDMCSMGFAPIRGEIKDFSFAPTSIHSRLNCFDDNPKMQRVILDRARDFWDRVRRDEFISEEFREFLNRSNPIDALH